MIYGTITTDGQPREGVVVEYDLFAGGCDSGKRLPGGGAYVASRSNNIGRFRFQAYSLDPTAPQCLRLYVRKDDSTRGVSGDAPNLPLKPIGERNLPYDSIRIDVVVPKSH